MNSRYAQKQAEAILQARRSCYVSKFGFLPPEADESPDAIILIIAKQAIQIATEELGLPPGRVAAEKSSAYEESRDKAERWILEREAHFGTSYLYHPAFPSYFQNLIAGCGSYAVPGVLEEHFSIDSPYPPRQLDELQDYAFLAAILRNALAEPIAYSEQRLALETGLNWLKQKTTTQEAPAVPQPEPTTSTAAGPVGVRTAGAAGIPQLTAKRNPKRLTVDELALLCIYTSMSITRDNAKNHLEGGLTSGDALYTKYAYYSTISNRIGFSEATLRKRGNMIARIKKVLPRLDDEQKKLPEREIDTLKSQNQ